MADNVNGAKADSADWVEAMGRDVIATLPGKEEIEKLLEREHREFEESAEGMALKAEERRLETILGIFEMA